MDGNNSFSDWTPVLIRNSDGENSNCDFKIYFILNSVQGCDFRRVISLPNGNGDLSQFRIQLTPADTCYCVTIDSASGGPYAQSILDKWKDIWKGQQDFCADDQPRNFISEYVDFQTKNMIQVLRNGDPPESMCLGKNSFPNAIINNEACESILQSFCSNSNASSSPTPLFCPALGIWNQTLAFNTTKVPAPYYCLNSQMTGGYGKVIFPCLDWCCYVQNSNSHLSFQWNMGT